MTNDLVWFLSTSVVLCVALPLVPIAAFLLAGWHAKRNDITDGVSFEAKRCYLMMFSLSNYNRSQLPFGRDQGDAISEAYRCEKIFADFYTRWYGRRHYMLPAAIFIAVLAGLSVYVAFSPVRFSMKTPEPLAIAGASTSRHPTSTGARYGWSSPCRWASRSRDWSSTSCPSCHP